MTLGEIDDNPRNPKTHPQEQQDALEGVLREVGWAGVPLAYYSARAGGRLAFVDGHLRKRTVPGLTVRVAITDLTDEEADLLLLAYDPIAQLAKADKGKLEELLLQVKSEDPAVAQFLEYLANQNGLLAGDFSPEGDREPTVAESAQEKWAVQAGDLWRIPSLAHPGQAHYLLCGDCSIPANVKQLLGDRKVALLLTDPPYGVDYGGKSDFLDLVSRRHSSTAKAASREVANDARTDYRAFFASFLRPIPWASYNTFYIFMSGRELHNLRLALDDCRLTLSTYLVWVKNLHVPGRSDYSPRHEFVAMGDRRERRVIEAAGPEKAFSFVVYGWSGRHKFYRKFCTTVLEYDKPAANPLHPTQKPVELIARLMSDGSKRGDVVYDPFSGSGTMFEAAETMGRLGFGFELKPELCSVILERLAGLGLKPEKVENGNAA